jgi:GNAT acetyltransferase-like protein
MSEEYQVRILKSKPEIEEFRNFWKALPSLPYSDIDFFLTSLKSRTEIAPYVIVTSLDGVPQNMVVGIIETSVLPVKISHWTLFRAAVRTLVINPGGVLGNSNPASTGALVAALTQVLRGGVVDALRLPQTRKDSEFFKQLQEATPFLCKDGSLEYRLHWQMKMPESVADIHSGFSSEHRKKLRWQNKNLEKNFPGAINIRCFQDAAELETMIRDVETISQKTYQRSLGAAFIDTPATRARVQLEAEKNWLRMYVLYVAGQPTAYWWGLIYNNTFHSNAMGFDPERRRFSPGTYLLTKTLEDLHQKKIEHIDFGAGDFHYKQQFGTENWEETMVYSVFAPRVRPVFLNLTIGAVGKFRFLTRAILKRTRLIDVMKNYWRRKLEAKSESPASLQG